MSLNIQVRIALKSMDYREVVKKKFFDRRYPRPRQKDIMYACSNQPFIYGHLRPMPRFVFKFIRIRVDGENIENDTKTIV